MRNFKPQPEPYHKLADLVVLFDLTKAIGREWSWISYYEDKASLIVSSPSDCIEQCSGPIAAAFAAEYELYSSSYFAAFDELMKNNGV